MIGRVYFDGVDVTSRVNRRGIGNLTAETQNDEGAQTMGSARITFNNMTGYFNDYGDNIDPVGVEIWAGSSRLFSGQTDPENSVGLPDRDTFSCECTSEDRSWLDTMKSLKLADSAVDVERKLLEVFAESNAASNPANVEGRYFWSLKSLIEHLTIPAVPVSFQITGEDLSQYYLGGRPFNIALLLPNITAAQLVKDTAGLFNAMYYMENGVLTIRDRRSFIQSSDTPLDLPLVRGSVKLNTRRCGLDRAQFQFANADENQRAYQYAYFGGHATVRDATALSFPLAKEVTSSFLQANTAERARFYQPQAFISRDNNENESLYLVRNRVWGEYTGPGSWVFDVAPTEPLSWYECEFKGLMEWEASYIVMDNEAAMAELIKPLRQIVHPAGRKTINMVRSATIDLDQETVTVKGVEFLP